MRVVVTAEAVGVDAQMSQNFGRCAAFVFVDSETGAWDAEWNPAAGDAGGAGVRAAEFVIRGGAGAVITGRVGPKAYAVLERGRSPVYRSPGGTVRDVVEAYRAGRLAVVSGANA